MKRKLQIMWFFMFVGFILSLMAFTSCDSLLGKINLKDNAEKNAAIKEAKTLLESVKLKLNSSENFISADLSNEVKNVMTDLQQKIDNKSSKSSDIKKAIEKLKTAEKKLDEAIKNSQAQTEISAAEKSITAGKAAAQTAKEKNTRAKEVKVEDSKLIAEALIQAVTDKAAAVTTAKTDLSNLELLTGEQIKAKTENLKQSRLALETATSNLAGKITALDAEIAGSPITKAQEEISAAEKAITAGKAAAQTAKEKNTRAKEVKVEDSKLIAEALIQAVTDKAAAVTTAKTDLSNLELLTGEQIKAKTENLKQSRLALETATSNLAGKFAALDAEIAEKEPPMPMLQGEDEDGHPVVVSTKNGKSISYEDLMKFKNKEENKNKILNTENIAVKVDDLTPAVLIDFFKNFTHLNIDISEEIQVTSNDTQDPDADGNPQYFKASDLSDVSDRINFVDNSSGSMNPFKTFQFENIKGNIVISDTFSRFEDRELEAFVTGHYNDEHNGIVIPRTKTWVTFSQLTKLIRWLKKYEFFNNKVRFGDMLVVNKRDGDQGVLNCLDTMINENIERFELKNNPGEEYSIKFAGAESIPCYFILNGYPKKSEINVKQLLQISKRCRWKMLYRHDDGTVSDTLTPESMVLRFNKIKNLNCKKLSADELKDLTFEHAAFGGVFEGEDTDLSEISFEGAHNGGVGLVSFTGILPKNQRGARYSYLIIRDAEIPDINTDGYNYPPITPVMDYDARRQAKKQARKEMSCLPSYIDRLIVHNLKGLDKICKGLTKKEMYTLHSERTFEFYYGNLHMGDGLYIGDMYIGSKEIYEQFNRLCAFRRMSFFYDEDAGFVCFTDKNNTILQGPYKRMPDKVSKTEDYNWEYIIEDGEFIPVPPGKYKQDEDGFFEEK